MCNLYWIILWTCEFDVLQLYGEHWKIKGSRSKKSEKLLTCLANSLFKVHINLS